MNTLNEKEMAMYLKGRFEGMEKAHTEMKESLKSIEQKLDDMTQKIDRHQRWFNWLQRLFIALSTFVIGTLTLDWKKVLESIKGAL